MFTGIVENMGRLTGVTETDRGRRLTIEMDDLAHDLAQGDSVAIDGTCLTVVELEEDTASFEAVTETLSRTTLGDRVVGDNVNLERPTRVGDRLDGHIVSGHVDGVGSITAISPEQDGSRRMTIEAPEDLLPYVIEKGSVCVDGISLTVAALTDTGFEIALIPHTLEVTVLGTKEVGDRINLEMDMIAKYVERLVGTR